MFDGSSTGMIVEDKLTACLIEDSVFRRLSPPEIVSSSASTSLGFDGIDGSSHQFYPCSFIGQGLRCRNAWRHYYYGSPIGPL